MDYLGITLIGLTTLPTMTSAQEACYPAGGVAGIVIATIVVTAVVIGLSLAAIWKFWQNKKVQIKRPESNHKQTNEKIPGDFAFDNPYFREQEDDETDAVKHGKARSSINNKSPLRSSKQSDLSTKGKKIRSGKSHFIFGGQGKKQRAMDDSCLAVDPERTIVSLRGHDFTGLGFNICGNMRDGILVKDVLHRGPASESGKIKAGDRIISVTVSFTNIVYEDALTILSYASPYDVQLELERMATSSKTSGVLAVGESPSGSKRLGSCSFSSSGPKLFHPLYRSQSIDDLTQIDRDTFPSHHGFGPRRSQSVGVAAHKLASHFKNSDSTIVEEDKKKRDARNSGSTSVILSTTGSLNEKMLANVITDGALHNKSGGLLHWEKRFEDTLENDDSTCLESSTKKKHISSTSSSNDDSMDEVVTQSCKNKSIKGSSENYSSKHQKINDSSYSKQNNFTQNDYDMKTSAEVYRSQDSKGKRSNTKPETSSDHWHLDKSGTKYESDLDTSESLPWNNRSPEKSEAKNTNQLLKKSHEKTNSSKKLSQNFEEDSDVSNDSFDNGRKRRVKQTKKHKTSLHDLQQSDDAACSYGHYNKNISDYDKVSANYSSHQKPNKNITNEALQDTVSHKSQMQPEKYSVFSQSQYINSSISQLSNKEKKLERAVINASQSPKLSIRSQKAKCDSSENIHFHSGCYSNSHLEESSSISNSKCSDKSGNYDKQAQTCSRIQSYPVSNNLNSPKQEKDESKGRMTSHQHQRVLCNHQKQSQFKQVPNEQEISSSDTKNVLPVTGYTQVLRKTVNPAGMFTQINPFQQISRSKNNNINPLSKSWAVKDSSKNSLPVNGNDFRYHPQYTKNVPTTSADSIQGRSKNRGTNHSAGDTQVYAQSPSERTHSKAVLISTYDHTNNASTNFRQMRNQ